MRYLNTIIDETKKNGRHCEFIWFLKISGHFQENLEKSVKQFAEENGLKIKFIWTTNPDNDQVEFTLVR